MKVLVINGSCLFVNSSANLCHLAYLQGLIDAGIDVSLLSASPQSYFTDSSMKIPDGVDCHHVQAPCMNDYHLLKEKLQEIK